MSFTYSVFGVTLRSTASIPGLSPLQIPAERVDIELDLGSIEPFATARSSHSESVVYISAYTGPSGAPALRILQGQNGLFHLVYFDGMQFWMDRHGTKLWASWPSESSVEDAATYILGPVLGLLLRFRGITCLHASAVAIGTSVVAFVGAEGAGKSTTAAAFARAGFAAVSDDVVALVEREGDFFVSPSYPHLCLWPESVEILYGTADALPPFVPNWEKRRLSVANGGARFEDGPLPLRAIYLLDEIRSDPGPHVEAVTAQTGFLSLVANSFATNMLDSEMRANEFRTLSSLVAKVPLRRLFTSKGHLAPADLCQAVLHDVASLVPQS
ncbi:MAG TPA: hypothetical protein VGH17_00940 [Candidatus Acidoferrales bacterium]